MAGTRLLTVPGPRTWEAGAVDGRAAGAALWALTIRANHTPVTPGQPLFAGAENTPSMTSDVCVTPATEGAGAGRCVVRSPTWNILPLVSVMFSISTV